MNTLQSPVQNQSLTSGEIKFWDENGYVIRERVFSPEECDALSAQAQHLATDQSLPPERRQLNKMSVERGDKDPIMHSVMRPDVYSDLFLNHLRDARLTEPMASLLGPDLLVQSNLFLFKAPGVGLPFPWHQDMWFFRSVLNTPSTIGTWQAMDDSYIANGSMWVIPGSHLWPIWNTTCRPKAHNKTSFGARAYHPKTKPK